MYRRSLLLLFLALGQSALAADLRADLDRLLATIPAGGRSAVVVYDLATSKLLYGVRGGESLAPASVAKLIVSAAALLELGPQWTFTTTVHALGPVRDGALPGLGVIASGDPCFDTHFHPDPDAPFKAWAAALRGRGVTRIAGDLVIDTSRFSGPIRPATYPADHENQQSWYSAPASAFAWNDNCIEVRVVPTKPGEACTVAVRPRSSRIAVRNLTRTVAGRGDTVLTIDRASDANAITVSGAYGRANDWFALAIHSDPDLLAGDHLRAVLADAGIPLLGRVVIGPVPPDAETVATTSSPLGPAVTILNRNSQNFYGEQILRVLGQRRRQEGSITAGCLAVQDILRQHLGQDLSGWTLLDGCGLSYGNQACADFLIRLLAQMDASPVARDFRASLKVEPAGKTTALLKSGTIAIARCYAGYIERSNGTRVAFAILLNKGQAKSMAWGVTLRKKLLEAICKGVE